MALKKVENPLLSVLTVIREKAALASKERTLIQNLNRILRKMGYEIVKSAGTSRIDKKRRRMGRRTRQKGLKRGPGRPRLKSTARRGRPPKTA